MIVDKYKSCEDDSCECECHECETYEIVRVIGCQTPGQYKQREMMRSIYEPMLKKQLAANTLLATELVEPSEKGYVTFKIAETRTYE